MRYARAISMGLVAFAVAAGVLGGCPADPDVPIQNVKKSSPKPRSSGSATATAGDQGIKGGAPIKGDESTPTPGPTVTPLAAFSPTPPPTLPSVIVVSSPTPTPSGGAVGTGGGTGGGMPPGGGTPDPSATGPSTVGGVPGMPSAGGGLPGLTP